MRCRKKIGIWKNSRCCSQRTLQCWNREAWQYSTDAGCYIENHFIQAMPYPPVVQKNSTFAHAAVAGEYLQRLCPGYLSRTRWDSQDTTLVVSWMKMGEVCFGTPTLSVCINLNDSTSEKNLHQEFYPHLRQPINNSALMSGTTRMAFLVLWVQHMNTFLYSALVIDQDNFAQVVWSLEWQRYPFSFFEALLLKAYDAKETAPQKVMDAPEPTVLTGTTTEPEESTQSTRPASLDLASFPSFLLKDQTHFFLLQMAPKLWKIILGDERP